MRRASHTTAEATLLRLAEGLKERTAPECPHFGSCGGCQLQHLPYEAQVAAKRAMLLHVLNAAGIADVPSLTVHTASAWHYRNRIRMRIEGNAIGYSRRESNEFLAIEACPIASPLLIRAAMHMRDAVRETRAAWPEGAVGFELFTDADDHRLQISLHLEATIAEVSRDAPAQFRALCDEVQRRVPELVGAGLLAAAPDPQQSRRVQATQRAEIARWGDAVLPYLVDGREYRVTRNAFFQVNRFLTAEMVHAVVAGRSGTLAFDLFAGAGLFSVPLTERFRQVVSVEVGEPAFNDLRWHLASAGPPHQAVHSTTEAFLQHEPRTPDLVVMDPPRAGVSLPALRSLTRLAPREIVYVSCDADTFARDAATLLKSGYTLEHLHLFDLFPQTFHTETCAVFRL